MDRKPKTVFQLDSPFTTAAWPRVSTQDQETILELLCRLLSPIGQHREGHLVKSKGKRCKKRKRPESKQHEGELSPGPPIPPIPEISSFIAVGLNTVTRRLQALSQRSNPQLPPNDPPLDSSSAGEPAPNPNTKTTQDTISPRKIAAVNTTPPPSATPFSAIFVLRSSQPSILHAHLPQLITTASLAHLSSPATRLVQLPRGSEERVCQALGLPRVSFIGLVESAPHSKSLVEVVRQCVPEIEIPWLKEVRESKYLPVKINAIETFAAVSKKGLT